jgi:hypothetical protein
MVRFWAFSILFFAYFNSYSQSCVDDGFWKIGSQFGTKRLSSNYGDYNCHGFAAAYWEGGLNTIPDWGISNPGSVTVASQYTFSGGGPDQNYFKNSNQYIQVCDESFSTVDVITQKFNIADGFHSLVRDQSTSSFSPKFISKYGTESPVIGHDFNSTWYELNNATKTEPDKYYAFIGKLDPSAIIPKDQTKTISLLSKAGVSYQWSIEGGNGIVSITSSTNGGSVTVKGNSYGTVILKVILTGCSGVTSKTQTITLSVPNITISGNYNTSTPSNHVLGNANQVPTGNVSTYLSMSGVNNFVWERYQGNLTYWANTNQMHFTMQAGNNLTFRVYARNAANDTLAIRNVTYYNFGNFLLYPNPNNSSLGIKTEYQGTLDVEIISLSTEKKKSFDQVTGNEKMDITDLPKGEYLVIVWVKGERVLESRLVKNE